MLLNCTLDHVEHEGRNMIYKPHLFISNKNVLVGSLVLFHNKLFCVAVDGHLAQFLIDFINKQLVNDATTKEIAYYILTFVVLCMVIFVA